MILIGVKENELMGRRPGVLQKLFMITSGRPFSIFDCTGWKLKITNRDKYVVATVIQWLGTNVGWCFLEECLKECGYTLHRTEEQKKKDSDKLKKAFKAPKN